jgi:hypothetical protein
MAAASSGVVDLQKLGPPPRLSSAHWASTARTPPPTRAFLFCKGLLTKQRANARAEELGTLDQTTWKRERTSFGVKPFIMTPRGVKD